MNRSLAWLVLVIGACGVVSRPVAKHTGPPAQRAAPSSSIAAVASAAPSSVAEPAPPASARFDVAEIAWVDEEVGWGLSAGAPVIVSRTEDGGRHWQERARYAAEADDVPPSAIVAVADRRHAWVAWMAGPEIVEVARTEDAGDRWELVTLKPSRSPRRPLALRFTSPGEGRLDVEADHGMSTPVGWGSTFLTHDGGATWVEAARPVSRGWTDEQACSTCRDELTFDGQPVSLTPPKGVSCSAPMSIVAGPELDRAGNGLLLATCDWSAGCRRTRCGRRQGCRSCPKGQGGYSCRSSGSVGRTTEG